MFPQVLHQPQACGVPVGAGLSREESNTVHGTGSSGVRGKSRSHRIAQSLDSEQAHEPVRNSPCRLARMALES
ncbi:hypothetical protein E8E68_11145 [Pseudomonas sp. BN607]|nr:hypothetical protein [Pseudomonas sp. BN607]